MFLSSLQKSSESLLSPSQLVCHLSHIQFACQQDRRKLLWIKVIDCVLRNLNSICSSVPGSQDDTVIILRAKHSFCRGIPGCTLPAHSLKGKKTSPTLLLVLFSAVTSEDTGTCCAYVLTNPAKFILHRGLQVFLYCKSLFHYAYGNICFPSILHVTAERVSATWQAWQHCLTVPKAFDICCL